MSSRRKSPPLIVWSITLLISGAILFLIVSISSDTLLKDKRLISFNHNLGELKATYSPDPEACQVIFWGSSLTRQGVDSRRAFQRDIADRSQQNIEVQKMIITGGSPEILADYHGLFETTEDYIPELLLIEDYLLLFTSRKKYSLRKDKRRNLLRQLYAATKKTKTLSFDLADQNLRKPNLGDTINFATENRQLINPLDYEDILSRIKRISDLGTPIVVVDTPRPAPLQVSIKDAEMQLKIDELINSLQEFGISISYWKYPHLMPFSFFSDPSWHLSETGMKIYSSWLSEKIIEQLAGQCQK